MIQHQGKRSKGGVFDDSYELVSSVGCGSSSIIYLARPLTHGRTDSTGHSHALRDESSALRPECTSSCDAAALHDGADSSDPSDGADFQFDQSEGEKTARDAKVAATSLRRPIPADLPPEVIIKLASPGSHELGREESYLGHDAECLSRISHKNVIGFYDYVKRRDTEYLVLEYAPLGDLGSAIKGFAQPLAPERALRILLQILAGVDAIHHAGIIHRDIKPANILISDRSTVKLTDFSIALLPEQRGQVREGGAPVGTLDYAAPEFLMSRDVSERSDLYAVGVTLYELLTKHLPFEGDSMSRQLNRKVSGIRTPLATYVGYETALLERLLDRALAPDPTRRFQSATEFRRAVEATIEAVKALGTEEAYAAAAVRPQPVRASTTLQLRGGTVSEATERRTGMQLQALRDSRVRSRTEFREFAPFERRHSKRLRSIREHRFAVAFSTCIAVLAVGFGIKLFGMQQSAVASLVTPPQSSDRMFSKYTFVEGLNELVFGEKTTSYQSARQLTLGSHIGVMKNLFAEGEDVPFAIHGVDGSTKFLFALGVPGWKARTVVLSPHSSSREIRIGGHGLNISFYLGSANDGAGVLRGNYREHLSGREGVWEIPVGRNAS